MTIEVFYIDGCPNHEQAIGRVKTVLRALSLPDDVGEVRIADSNMAKKTGFPGSPTIRVNGLDVEPSARDAKEAAFACRTYVIGTKREGVPSVQLIRQALEQAQSSETG